MAHDPPGRSSGGADEAVKPAILGIMLNLIRTSSLAGKIDASEILTFVSSNWRSLYKAGSLDVGPLYQELQTKKGVAPDEVAQIFLLLKKREAKLGVTVKLPEEIARLPADKQDALLREVMRAGVQSGVTLVGMPKVKIAGEAQKPTPGAAAGLTERVRSILNTGTPPKK